MKDINVNNNIAEEQGAVDKDKASLTRQGVQHGTFQDGHLSSHYPRTTGRHPTPLRTILRLENETVNDTTKAIPLVTLMITAATD